MSPGARRPLSTPATPPLSRSQTRTSPSPPTGDRLVPMASTATLVTPLLCPSHARTSAGYASIPRATTASFTSIGSRPPASAHRAAASATGPDAAVFRACCRQKLGSSPNRARWVGVGTHEPCERTDDVGAFEDWSARVAALLNRRRSTAPARRAAPWSGSRRPQRRPISHETANRRSLSRSRVRSSGSSGRVSMAYS